MTARTGIGFQKKGLGTGTWEGAFRGRKMPGFLVTVMVLCGAAADMKARGVLLESLSISLTQVGVFENRLRLTC